MFLASARKLGIHRNILTVMLCQDQNKKYTPYHLSDNFNKNASKCIESTMVALFSPGGFCFVALKGKVCVLCSNMHYAT